MILETKLPQKRWALLTLTIICLFSSFFSFGQCIPKTQESSINLIKDGFTKFKDKNYEDAAKRFASVDRNDSNYVFALIELINCNQQLKRDSLNLPLCDELINRYPNEHVTGMLLKANAYDNLGNFNKAKELYKEGITKYPRAHSFVYELGLAYLKGKKYKEAQFCFRQVIHMNPYYAPAHLQMAAMALRQGKFVPAILAYEFFLLNENQSARAKRVVTFIESAVKGEINEDEEKEDKFTIPEYKELDDFSELESLLKSKIAISNKYKSKIDLNYNLTKQMQLISEKVRYSAADTGFYMQFYARFFEELEKKNYFEPFTYLVLSGMEIPDVEKWSKRHTADSEKFKDWCTSYLEENYQYYADEINGVKGDYSHIFSKSRLWAMVKGKPKLENKSGEWFFFHPNGNLRSYGPYVNNEQKGEWHFFYENGDKKEVSVIENGKLNGISTTYFTNGAPKSKLNYSNGTLEGEQTLYYENGTVKGIYNFKKDLKEGAEKEYYRNGQLRYETSYQNGKANGICREYYQSGNQEGEFSYVNGKKEGKIIAYFDSPDKIIKAEGYYTNNESSGEWKFYDEQKNLTKKGSFGSDGNRIGTWIGYHPNGKIDAEETYGSGGKLNGPYKSYTEAGVLVEEFVYKNGKLTDYKQFDRNGKLLAEGNRERKKIDLKIYHNNGNIQKQGQLENNMSVGEWIYYDVNGVLKSRFNFKEDVEDGPSVTYFADGSKRSELNYKEGKAEGCFKRYNEFGVLTEEGIYKNGLKEGYWINYNDLGVKLNELYYENDNRKGLQYYYAHNGRITRVASVNENEFEEWTEYYDTLGKLKQVIPFKPGKREVLTKLTNDKIRTKYEEVNGVTNGKVIRYYPNGKIQEEAEYKYDLLNGTVVKYNTEGKVIYKATYKDDELHGTVSNYYDSGTLKDETEYKNGQRQGKSTSYHPNGKKEREMNLKDGDLEGLSVNYDDAGEVIVQRFYEKDNLVYYQYYDAQGKLTEPAYSKNGNIDVKAFFKNGKPSLVYSVRNGEITGRRIEYHSNGAIIQDEELKLGLNIGVEKTFYANGKPRTVLNYKNGKLHGNCMFYNENGTLRQSVNFDQGEEWGMSKLNDSAGKLIQTIYYYDGIIEEIK